MTIVTSVKTATQECAFGIDGEHCAGLCRETHRPFRELLENLALIALTLSPKGKITFCNDYLLEITGWERADVIGQDWFDRFVPRSDSATREVFAAAINHGEVPAHYENSIYTRTGGLRDVLWSNTVLRDERGRVHGVACVGEDVTEKKRAQKQMAAALKFKRTMLDASPMGIITYAADGSARLVNKAAARLVGTSVEQLKAQNFRRIKSWRKAGLFGAAEQALKSGREVELEARLITSFGKEAWLAFRFISFDHENERHLLVMFSDIAEQKNAELGLMESEHRFRLLEEQLRHAQKMEAIGLLAGGVAHDFNNLLAVINGYSELLLNHSQSDSLPLEFLSEIRKAGERAVSLTRQLLMFSRKRSAQMTTLNLNDVISELAKMLRRLIGENISLELSLADGLPLVSADAGMLEQVLMNLSVNARDAMPRGGALRIQTERVQIVEGDRSFGLRARPGEFVVLTVKDSGCGIPRENLSRIFEPFFTTKDPGKGTGLGLATVLGILDQHSGWIDVQSEPGHGSSFRAFIPVSVSPVHGTAAERDYVALRGKGETVLVVEDDSAVQQLAGGVLRKLDYRVVLAADAEEALAWWSDRGERVDVLLTDVILPGLLTGRDLASRLQIDQPELKVIYQSGYSEEVVGQVFAPGERRSFLQKPFTPRALAEAIRQVLD